MANQRDDVAWPDADPQLLTISLVAYQLGYAVYDHSGGETRVVEHEVIARHHGDGGVTLAGVDDSDEDGVGFGFEGAGWDGDCEYDQRRGELHLHRASEGRVVQATGWHDRVYPRDRRSIA